MAKTSRAQRIADRDPDEVLRRRRPRRNSVHAGGLEDFSRLGAKSVGPSAPWAAHAREGAGGHSNSLRR